MKFARYLEETQTPEWKKAYIDYRGLKKHINVIQAAREEHQEEIIENVDKAERPRSRSATPPLSPHKRLTFVEDSPEIALRKMNRMSDPHVSPGVVGMARGGLNRLSLRGILPNLMARSRPVSTVSSTIGRRVEPSLSLHEILSLLSPQEAAFFTLLDKQLEKVESFFCAREEEMLSRGHLLQSQLKGLNEHRNTLQNTPTPVYWAASLKSAFNLSRLGFDSRRTASPTSTLRVDGSASPSTLNSFPTFISTRQFPPQDSILSVALSPSPSIGKRRETDEEILRGRSRNMFMPNVLTGTSAPTPDTDSDRYISARRKLKKAVLEHYRGLELLDNYRIVNQTGFRKILKKFEKRTKMPVQHQYMSEKVDNCAFAFSGAIKDMMKQMEVIFAVAFLDDDKKKATIRLRTVTTPRTYHHITLRVGLCLGLAVPALLDGLYKVSQPSTRNALPSWQVLLYLYGVLVLPIIFALLVGLNLAVWASARINYVFIFELDVLSRIDHREFFEIPAFLFTTLIYSFWLTFCRIGHHATLWPLIWFLFAIVVIINPLPIMHRGSRYWLLRSLGKQFLSGTRAVDFTDFWMGDQLCSMTFTLSHLATFVCAYVHEFRVKDGMPHDLNTTCGIFSSMWGIELTLLCIPQAIRLIQSVKRYADSTNNMHLINAGKYATGIIYSCVYLKWRKKQDDVVLFTVWCLCGVFSSLYGCAWDLLMDWSLLNRRDTKYPFLRLELLYPNHVPLYYFAIVTNILGRFSWVLYTPKNGPDFLARTFFVALLEMFRRFQWNFFRLENEHLGNVDQYRATREVPLPYPREAMITDDDEVERGIRVKIPTYRT